MEAKDGGEGGVVKSAIAVVAIECSGVVGEIGFENIEIAVAVVVGNGGTHAGLFAAVVIEGSASGHGEIGEGSVAIVVIEDAGGAVPGNIDIRPALVGVVQRRNAESVVARGRIDVSCGGDGLESAMAAVSI